MKELKYKLRSVTAFEIAEDALIKNFCRLADSDIGAAITAYTEITKLLLSANKTLADYLCELLTYSESPLIESYLKDKSENQFYAIEYDVSVIRELAAFSAHKVKDYLFGKFNENLIFSLPEYVSGGFDKTAEYFIEHVRKYGAGIYARYKAFVYENGAVVPVENPDTVRLSEFKKYEAQRGQIVDNTRAFIAGQPADNVLLYGDRGTGKSSTIKALINEYDMLRIIQLDKRDVAAIPSIYEAVKNSPLKFIIFIDDLSFGENDECFGTLKKVLEGSLCVRPANAVIYATTNRRHLIKETESSRVGDNVHRADEIDESVSLSDRFGLFITFLAPNKDVYLEIVQGIAIDRGIIIDKDKLYRCAERFALRRNSRSPRTARQFIDSIQSKIALGIDID
ncbi:MAG: ATP-binding protein [Eubacterium sp.]|nr:ATP-binding protein [Eubacterium sp.]